MLAYANDEFRDYTLLPIFPLKDVSAQKHFHSKPTGELTSLKIYVARLLLLQDFLRHH